MAVCLEARVCDCREYLLLVSNRGPFEYRVTDAGRTEVVPGQGGVATALRLAAEFRPTVWLSSPMNAVERSLAINGSAGSSCLGSHFVSTDGRAYNLYYDTFASQALWFLQHDIAWPRELTANRRREAWDEGYVPVNQAFAGAVLRNVVSLGVRTVMFQDYHFYLAPLMVRKARPDLFLQHFVHIPWPESTVWSRLEPGLVSSICRGLLANDSVAFQTEESAFNFQRTCQAALPGAGVDLEADSVSFAGRTTRVWANPISVDPAELTTLTSAPEFRAYQRSLQPPVDLKLVVRVDRLDPAKNVLAGFQAYEHLLERQPELRGEVQFLAFLVPSRSDIPAYAEYERQTFGLIDRINARFGTAAWQPVRVFHENNRLQALAGMSLADVLLVNSVADGMNLVAKEGPLVSERDAVLVLSRRAGSYRELFGGALGIEPRDVDGTATALLRALRMDAAERSMRARVMRRAIAGHDLGAWFADLIQDADSTRPAEDGVNASSTAALGVA